MSASVPASATPGGLRAAFRRASVERLGHEAGLGTALFAGLSLIAFLTTGGEALAANTAVEIALVLLGLTAAGALVLLPAPAPRHGGAAFALFAALTALSALSIAWSVQPADSWIEANRAVAYLAVFGCGIALARLLGTRWAAVAGALAAYAALISGYALLVKVFPGALDAGDTVGRLSAPFDYWNATGVVAAIGLPAALWVGARREPARLSRGLSVPMVAVELTVVVLSYSRSAVLAALAALATWFILAPLRLRSAALLGAGGAGATVICGWALHTHALTHDRIPLTQRIGAGQGFGVLLLCAGLILLGVGIALAFYADRLELGAELRRRIGLGLIGCVCLIPLGGLAGLAASSRGFTGEVSHIWGSLTTVSSHVGDSAGRLTQLASTRPFYWSQGLKVGEHNLLHGAGALGYATARLRYVSDPHQVIHAHSYLIETFADFGLLGLVVNLGLLVVWALAVRRTIRATHDAERAAAAVMLAGVLAFGVQSMIDWTWFVPGVAIPTLLCAGWLTGRAPGAPRPRPVSLARAPLRALTLAGLSTLALLTAWTIWQPLRSEQADASSIQFAAARDTRDAITEARTAAAEDPVSIDPLFQLSELYSAVGQPALARATLQQATGRQPENPLTWQTLGLYDLAHRRYRAALGELRTALPLAPGALPTIQGLAAARHKLARPSVRSRP